MSSPARTSYRMASLVLLGLMFAYAPRAFAVGTDGIYIPWVKSFCGGNTMILEAEVCNQTSQQRGWWVEFVDNGPFSGCDVAVVPQHNFITNLPILLMPGECTTVQIEVTKPSELMTHDQVCYWLKFNPDFGGTVILGGYLTDRIDLCFDWYFEEAVVFLHPMDPVTVPCEVECIGQQPVQFIYYMRAYADFDWVDSDLISIDGMPPGHFAFGEEFIPEGETIVFEHTVEWLQDEPSRFIDLVVLDESSLAPLTSIGLHQIIEVPTNVDDELPAPNVRSANLRVSPNPSQGPTAILWESSEPAPLRLQIHDAAGRQVRGLSVSPQGPGSQHVMWDGRDDSGAPVTAGAYWVRLPGVAKDAASKLLVVR